MLRRNLMTQLSRRTSPLLTQPHHHHHRLQRVAVVASSSSSHARSFWGGAFENEYEEKAAMKRRSRLRSFLSALDQLPATSVETDEVVAGTLAEHAPSCVSSGRPLGGCGRAAPHAGIVSGSVSLPATLQPFALCARSWKRYTPFSASPASSNFVSATEPDATCVTESA